MSKVSKSPNRNTFQKESYIKRCREEGIEPNPAYLKMYEDAKKQDKEWAQHEHSNDLEYDLRSTDWILEKVRNSDSYAQNVYAALCNMRWCNIKGLNADVTMDILRDEFWSCSWRHAGGIVADMLQKGDYIDWYCSGIRDVDSPDNGSVPEGTVTEEIAQDFATLGWVPREWSDD